MNRFHFSNIRAVVIDGTEWSVDHYGADGLSVRSQTGQQTVFAWDAVMSLSADGRLTFREGACRLPAGSSQAKVSDLHHPPAAAFRQRDRHRYLGVLLRYATPRCQHPDRRAKDSFALRMSDHFLNRLAHEIASAVEPNGAADAPSARTLRRWYRRERLAGHDFLPPPPRRKQRPPVRLLS